MYLYQTWYVWDYTSETGRSLTWTLVPLKCIVSNLWEDHNVIYVKMTIWWTNASISFVIPELCAIFASYSLNIVEKVLLLQWNMQAGSGFVLFCL